MIAYVLLSFTFPHQNLYFVHVFQRSPYYTEEIFENEYIPPKPEKEAPGAEIPAADPATNTPNPTITLSTANLSVPVRHLQRTTIQSELDP